MLPNCCLAISFVYSGQSYYSVITPVYNESGQITRYEFGFSYQVEESTVNVQISMIYYMGSWFMLSGTSMESYYSLGTDECPIGSGELWTVLTESPLFESFEITEFGCHAETLSCCLTINIEYNHVLYQPTIIPVYNYLGEIIYYTFTLETIDGDLPMNLIQVDGLWSIIGGESSIVYYTLESDICPISFDTSWNVQTEEPLFNDFSISWEGCIDETPECCLRININYYGVWYSVPITATYDLEDNLSFYKFLIEYETEGGPQEFNVVLAYSDGLWYFYDSDSLLILYTLEQEGCPSSNLSQWQLQEGLETNISDFTILSVGCEQVVPFCCLSTSIYLNEEAYTVDIVPVYNEASVLTNYSFTLEYNVGEGTETIVVNVLFYDGVWYMVDANTSFLYYSFASNECPGGFSSQWTAFYQEGIFDDFIIFSLDCPNEPNDDEFLIEEDKPMWYPCKYKNLIKKVKMSSAKRIADMKDVERFKLEKCLDRWGDIMKDYLIINALQCAPYNEYTGLDEKCLIGKLTDKFNC